MANRFLDFDAFLSEKEEKTIDVRIFGKVYTVSANVPAILPLKYRRAQKDRENPEMQSEVNMAVFDIADMLFGKEAMDEICGKGLSAADLNELVSSVLSRIQKIYDSEDDEEGETYGDVTGKRSVRLNPKK